MKVWHQRPGHELEGRKVALRRQISNGMFIARTGTVLTIRRKFRGFELEGDLCACCGVKPRFTRVDHFALSLQEEQEDAVTVTCPLCGRVELWDTEPDLQDSLCQRCEASLRDWRERCSRDSKPALL